ncbi:LAGLIDADG family homing endonuclease [Paenibacillus peoriae]|uniref:LAGLIDADG family homing endonuclease n=1 Tax=Paenibacillus peoriae TaxID=59893 RepID=UPI003F95E0FA
MSGRRQKDFNSAYFKTLNQESAYWLGFIQADGNISIDKRNPSAMTFSIEIDRKDEYHLERLRACLGAFDHEIKQPSKSTSRLRITSKELCTDLMSWGIKPRKSFTGTFPSLIPAELLSHYTRGVFDGDGCITIRKSGKPRAVIVGSKEYCTWTHAVLGMYAGITAGGVYPSSTIYAAEYVGRIQVSLFANYIYQDAALFLNRKKQIFDQTLDRDSQSGLFSVHKRKVA